MPIPQQAVAVNLILEAFPGSRVTGLAEQRDNDIHGIREAIAKADPGRRYRPKRPRKVKAPTGDQQGFAI